MRARADGEVAAHALQLELSGPQVSARASARGALAQAGSADWRWEGSVEELVADAPVPLRLERPARLLADGHGAVLGYEGPGQQLSAVGRAGIVPTVSHFQLQWTHEFHL